MSANSEEQSILQRVTEALTDGAATLAGAVSDLTGDDASVINGLINLGVRDENRLTEAIFQRRHPELGGRALDPDAPGDKPLVREWLAIRNELVRPRLTGGPARGADESLARPSAQPMAEGERRRLVAAAQQQGSSGDPALNAQMKAGLPKGKTLDGWFADHAPDATFLGLRVRASDGRVPGVHAEFADRLRLAEDALRARSPGEDDRTIRTRLGVRDIGGLRRPRLASGGSLPSMHCYGMAIDVNPGTNPFVGLKKVSGSVKDPAQRRTFEANRSPRVIARAMLLVHGVPDFNVEARLTGDAAAVWRQHDRASRALASYLQLADGAQAQLEAAVARARAAGDPHDLPWWRKRVADDRDLLPHWDFANHPAPERTGYMDLPEELVVALVDQAGMTWGGQYRQAKDMMHFDYRSGSIRRT